MVIDKKCSPKKKKEKKGGGGTKSMLEKVAKNIFGTAVNKLKLGCSAHVLIGLNYKNSDCKHRLAGPLLDNFQII